MCITIFRRHYFYTRIIKTDKGFEIEKITYTEEKAIRSMVIEITDEELIAVTGGIIQGMSGSPIIQNGMLVGAVTHVFLNDPTKGYGIFAETMIETADNMN